MELVAGIIMILAMVSTILSKYLTSARIIRLREAVVEAEVDVRAIRGRLKALENERAVAERNTKAIEKQKGLMEKQIANLEKELGSLRK